MVQPRDAGSFSIGDLYGIKKRISRTGFLLFQLK